MVKGQIKRQNSGLPKLEAVQRISNIPIIETGIKTAGNAYVKIKDSNRLINWYFDTTEATLFAVIESMQPAVKLLESSLRRFDQIMCKSLDIVEHRLPMIYLPPEMLISNTKEYVSNQIVRPVLKRADSIKEFGNAVLDSRVTNYAADRIDGAITIADTYVDKYLPVDSQDQTDANQELPAVDGNEKGAIKAIHHGQRFSRKLKRRLTQRTIAEVRALKKQSTEAVHVLLYAAELIVTDPIMAMKKTQELWEYLSKDEPENQARPQTLEQLIVLLTRESVRRMVHLINFTANLTAKIPKTLYTSTRELVHYFIYAVDSLVKVTRVEQVKAVTTQEATNLKSKVYQTYDGIQIYTNNVLERLALFLSGRIDAEKITTSNPRRRIHATARANNNPMQNNINGVY